MLPNFIKVFDFLLHSLESSFLWATPLVPTHKERNLCKMKRFSNSVQFKTWNSIPIPLKAGISGTKHKIHKDLRWKVHFSDLRSGWQVPAEFALGLLTWTRRKSWGSRKSQIPWGLCHLLGGENVAVAEHLRWGLNWTLGWVLNEHLGWGLNWKSGGFGVGGAGTLEGVSAAAAEQGRVQWQKFTSKKKAHIQLCVCKQLSAPQVSYGFVFSISGASIVTLSHQNLPEFGLWSFFWCFPAILSVLLWNQTGRGHCRLGQVLMCIPQINPTCSFLR